MRRLARPCFLLALATALLVSGTTAGGVTADTGEGHTRTVLVTFGCSSSGILCPASARALRRTGVSGRIILPDLREDTVATLSLIARQGYDVVFADITFGPALAIVAPRFPKTRFVLLDGPRDAPRGQARNVQNVILLPHEAAYLAGWLAARLERRKPGPDVVGVVAGIKTVPVEEFVVAFAAGARAADPGVAVRVQYSDDFIDPDKCAALARNEIARGAGAVFNIAGGCGLGTLAVARDEHVWGIGVDTDQSFFGPHILTSVIKGYGAGFVHVLAQVRDGTFHTGGTTALTLRDGGSRLGRISPKVPASLLAELAGIRRRIIAGTLKVPLPDSREP